MILKTSGDDVLVFLEWVDEPLTPVVMPYTERLGTTKTVRDIGELLFSDATGSDVVDQKVFVGYLLIFINLIIAMHRCLLL